MVAHARAHRAHPPCTRRRTRAADGAVAGPPCPATLPRAKSDRGLGDPVILTTRVEADGGIRRRPRH